MTMSPIFVGAGLALALGGALAGNAVGSTSMSDRAASAIHYQSHLDTHGARDSARVLPDHYPLVTREGVVPVARLSERGLFSQTRYRGIDAASAYAEDGPGPGFDTFDRTNPPRQDVRQTVASPNASAPLALADGAADVTAAKAQMAAAEGQAKIIDVQATLAMR